MARRPVGLYRVTPETDVDALARRITAEILAAFADTGDDSGHDADEDGDDNEEADADGSA